ncbi:MAG: hemerythrin domain-containing protein [Flavobacteriales bacterium]|nr:hemerythrin domain-containing protein [Flavobacteriales bacterium]
MKIIDTTTGKRIGQETREQNRKLKEEDPIIRNADKNADSEGVSPMDPPEAYNVQGMHPVAETDRHPLIALYMKEHVAALAVTDGFEKAVNAFKESGYRLNDEVNDGFRAFFDFFDSSLLDHNRREEAQLFGLLHQRLLESGEHSDSPNPTTAVDVMEDDHVKFIQLGALAFNLLGLAARLPDHGSRMFTYGVACDNARELIELLRLHLFREDNVLFPLAQKLIGREELDRM